MIQRSRFAFLFLLAGLTFGMGVLNAASSAAADSNAGWVEVGPGSAARYAGVSQTLDSSEHPKLVIGPDGTAVVAWETKVKENFEIYVRRWNGTRWEEMGAGSASGGGVSNTATRSTEPTITVASDGRPVVAWVERENEHSPGNIYVKAWNGQAWVEMGAGSATGDGISDNKDWVSYSPSLAIGPDKMPIIAWSEGLAGKSWIYIKRWNGSAWIEMGAGSASGGGISGEQELSSTPSLAVGPGGAPVVAWEAYANNNWEIYVKRWNGSTWVEMGAGSASGGGISNNIEFSYSPSLAIGPNGMPVVAWTDYYEDAARIYVRRWNGSAWVEMGAGSATTVGISQEGSNSSVWPSLSIGPDNMPVVAWESTAKMRVFIRQWNGATWQEWSAGSASGDGISGAQGSARHPSLAVGPDGRPAVAWEASANDTPTIYLRRWNDSAWVEMGANSASPHAGISSTGRAGNPAVAIGLDGYPIVAWEDDSSGNWEIYVKRWNGSTWVQMGAGSASGGGISKNGTPSRSVSLAVGPDGTTIVAWQDEYGHMQRGIYVRRWNGSAWVEMGAGSASGYGISAGPGETTAPTMVIGPDSVPVIAWYGTVHTPSSHWKIYIKRWNGSAWVGLGADPASSTVDAAIPFDHNLSLAIGPDKMPVIAWTQNITTMTESEVYVKRWNGSVWTELGPGSASGGGISNNPGLSSSPVLGIGSDGRPVIAWQEYFYRENNEPVVAVYMRRWTGSTWAEVGAGSASGEGISHNPANNPSTDPTMVTGRSGELIVAWKVMYTLDHTHEHIYVKHWNGSSWVEMGEGSASDQGITNFPGYASYPSMAVGPGKQPFIAWVDTNGSSNDIFVRRYPAACHALTLTHAGQGSKPTASPANSIFCPKDHYNAGETIKLTASPAPGWIVSNWTGTNNNSSIADANTATMPDAPHTVHVTYREFHSTDWSLIPVAVR